MTKKYIRLALLGVGLVVMMFCLPAKASAALKGVWHLQDRKNAHVSLEAAIDNAVKGMNYFVRRKGRSILESETQLCYTLTLATTRKNFVWQCDSQKASRISVRANRQTSKNSEQGQIKSTYRHGKRFASITVESKLATYTYSWSIIGKRHLEYTTTIQYKNIPRPLKWTLIYSKVMK